MRSHSRRFVGVFAVFVLVAAACDEPKDAELRAAIAEGCTINSECSSPLVCAFRTCHVECETTRDCVAYGSGLCVQSDKPYRVCQNPNEKTCVRNSDCPGEQICGPDARCRDACVVDRDCLTGQTCAAGACADPPDLINGKIPAVATVDAGSSCLRASDCPRDLVCLFNTCTVECVTKKDCEDGLACIATRCALPSVGAGGQSGAAGSGGSAAGGGGSAGGSGVGGMSGGGAGAVGGTAGASGASAGSGGLGGQAGAAGASTAGAGGIGGAAGAGAGAGGESGAAGDGGQAGAGGDAGQSGAGGDAGAGGAGGDSGAAGAGGDSGAAGAGGDAGAAGAGGDAGAAGAGGDAGAAGAGGSPALVTVLATTPGATYLALDDLNVYWITVIGTPPAAKGALYSVPKKGGKTTLLAQMESPVGLALDVKSAYWGVSLAAGEVQTVAKTGGTVATIAKGIPFLTDIAADDKFLYYSDSVRVMSFDLINRKEVQMIKGVKSPSTLANDPSFLFWADGSAGTPIPLMDNTAAGLGYPNDVKIIADAPKAVPKGMVATAGQLYWSEPENARIRMISAIGSKPVTFVDDPAIPYELAVDASTLYWTAGGTVSSRPLAGGSTKTHFSAGKDGRAIAVDGTDVFWVDAALGTVSRIAK